MGQMSVLREGKTEARRPSSGATSPATSIFILFSQGLKRRWRVDWQLVSFSPETRVFQIYRYLLVPDKTALKPERMVRQEKHELPDIGPGDGAGPQIL